MRSPHVLVLAKAPAPGRVKTRLSPPLSPAAAAAVAEAALADTLEVVAGCDVDRRILALDGPRGPWLPPGFEVIPQVSGSLNQRLAAAWEYAGGPGVQIGMDTPQVTPGLLTHALSIVMGSAADAALGLAEDGGWWAIALDQPRPGVFRGVPMSRPDTGRQQYDRLRALGLRVRSLPVLRDLDDVVDALAIAGAAPTSRTAGAVQDHVRTIARPRSAARESGPAGGTAGAGVAGEAPA
ncbi:TIGR04282 family arsenosugar biosynthesis glycosyltransferase [Phytoactinopolyspora limicola]|uniref:TIGR04282 family arsenosugar biosynthesis glycosyltransferase n=1 Tax=Phytoactinopolyspora limicola TaxID=2715536 RepID=UPI0014088BA6|nr:DUF2064 domain-containing protein [Phytoactinopolyspora limicola]